MRIVLQFFYVYICIIIFQQEATSSLKLSNVAGIFYLLLCGIVIGVTMALGEFFYKTSVEARHRKVSRGGHRSAAAERQTYAHDTRS